MSDKLRITVAICTWNRSKSLNATLSSLQRLIVPPEVDWELLIVNNNCTDDTDQITERFAEHLPVRLLHERKQGLSNARNCAVEVAKGDYILWTDDDVIVDPNWLVAYVNAARTWPDATLFGGPIKLKLEGRPPSWLLDMLGNEIFSSIYACRDLGSAPIKLNWNDWIIPYGANFFIRSTEQRKFLYNPRLGRYRKQLIGGEEVAVVKAMIDSGAEGWWVPSAMVEHVINEDLQTETHLRRYFVGMGRSHFREEFKDPDHKLFALSLVVRLISGALKWEVRYQLNRHRKRPKIWVEDLRVASLNWGELFEFLKLSFPT
jgi:glycosyltransferase involved in cell wall biosynthesis